MFEYLLILKSCANPDLGQSMAPAPAVVKTVRSLAEAGRAARAYIETHELGASNWAGGPIIDLETGVVVGRVSYNGRVWDLTGACLFDPFTGGADG